jgi:hypothetical protein
LNFIRGHRVDEFGQILARADLPEVGKLVGLGRRPEEQKREDKARAHMFTPNVAGQWRAVPDATNANRDPSARPLHQPGSAVRARFHLNHVSNGL